MNFNHILVVDSQADQLRLIPLKGGDEREFSLSSVMNRELRLEL